jgi:hypothetical protein
MGGETVFSKHKIRAAAKRGDINGVLLHAANSGASTRQLVVQSAGKLLNENNFSRVAGRCVEILRSVAYEELPGDVKDGLLQEIARAYFQWSRYGARDLDDVASRLAAIGAPAAHALNAYADEMAAYWGNRTIDIQNRLALDGVKNLAARILAGRVCVQHSLDASCKCHACGEVLHTPDARCVCRNCGQTDHKWSSGVYSAWWRRCERCGKERHIYE